MIEFNKFPSNITILNLTGAFEAYENGRYMFLSDDSLDILINKIHIITWDR